MHPEVQSMPPRSISTSYVRIRDMMVRAEQELPDLPRMPSVATRILRAKLILEEALETIEKGLGIEVSISGFTPISFDDYQFHESSSGDLAEVIDGCCDLQVVTLGTLISCGITDLQPQAEVDLNNLAKFGPGGRRRPDGKWLKPPGHQPPDILGCIATQLRAAITYKEQELAKHAPR